MKLEHFALNVKDPQQMMHWYSQHLGLKAVKVMDKAPYTTFMADDSGTILIEIYNNPANEVPIYKEMNPLMLHLAFVSAAPDIDMKRLLEAGASLESDQRLEDGSHLIMMRDPWGLSIQLCKRATPMLVNL